MTKMSKGYKKQLVLITFKVFLDVGRFEIEVKFIFGHFLAISATSLGSWSNLAAVWIQVFFAGIRYRCTGLPHRSNFQGTVSDCEDGYAKPQSKKLHFNYTTLPAA